jgi:hypothetical protein
MIRIFTQGVVHGFLRGSVNVANVRRRRVSWSPRLPQSSVGVVPCSLIISWRLRSSDARKSKKLGQLPPLGRFQFFDPTGSIGLMFSKMAGAHWLVSPPIKP